MDPMTNASWRVTKFGKVTTIATKRPISNPEITDENQLTRRNLLSIKKEGIPRTATTQMDAEYRTGISPRTTMGSGIPLLVVRVRTAANKEEIKGATRKPATAAVDLLMSLHLLQVQSEII